MLRKVLFAVTAFYLLGVIGVGGSYLSRNWSSEWALGDQLTSAVKIGVAWPVLVVVMVSRA